MTGKLSGWLLMLFLVSSYGGFGSPVGNQAFRQTLVAISFILAVISFIRKISAAWQTVHPGRRSDRFRLRRMSSIHRFSRVESVLPVGPAWEIPGGRTWRAWSAAGWKHRMWISASM